jgi:SpoIID/LytB domain protein
MIDCEPEIKVALLQNYRKTEITLNGNFQLSDGSYITGVLNIQSIPGAVILSDASGAQLAGSREVLLAAQTNSTFSLDVKIGIDFHWQQTQKQTFRGGILVQINPDSSFNFINNISLEDYITSVISSEMSALAPLEFLKAQAITARSWLIAMLERKKINVHASRIADAGDDEIIRWYDTNDHSSFDVCADDHCQRYQGITRITSKSVAEAVQTTHGMYLVYDNAICDARYYKACGGRTEIFSTAWEDKNLPFLQSVSDSATAFSSLDSEGKVRDWLTGRPPAYCNTQNQDLLSQILPSFDQETMNFYRWQVSYAREELEEILCKKSGIDFGTLLSLTAVKRGPSGRISKLKIEGTKRTVIVGKELTIRRWLSPSHLLSSAFVVSTWHSETGAVESFILDGGGWGHGVGLCQIGAAVMASEGFQAENILAHYFAHARLQKLY